MITKNTRKPTEANPFTEPNTNAQSRLNNIEKASLFYLFSVPLLVLLLGFGVGHVNWQWYLPGWLANILLMLAAFRMLLKRRPSGDSILPAAACLLVFPWIIFSIFAGMGRPPQTVKGWLELVGEQHVRYNLLIFGGIIAYLGTALLYQFLKAKEKVFTTLGMSLMTLALPLFLINMAYWGSFLSEAFHHFKTAARPDWYQPFQELFLLIDTIQVSLIYLASAMFALALGRTGHFRPVAVRIYVTVSFIAALLNLIPPSAPVPFSVISYVVSVPAIPLVMFYLIGINLLRTDSAD